MKILVGKTKQIYEEQILRVLEDFPSSTIGTITKVSDISRATLIKYLDILESRGKVTKTKEKNRYLWNLKDRKTKHKDINDFKNKIILGDCLDVMRQIPSDELDLIFADPPYNIGLSYENHNDNMKYEDYIHWCRSWIKECARLLSPKGSLYVAINDEHAAEIVMILKDLGLYMRNWIVWHYTFGQQTQRKFSRSHTHILYFTKEEKGFIFNADEIRVPSIRQLINDKRANPKGKIPDDVWQISRVAGTFKERIKGFPCQMPLKLLERVIKTSSNRSSIVLDPFCGSGTTLHAAKLLGRGFIGIEKSQHYRNISLNRVSAIK